MSRASGFRVFATAIGSCGIAWSENGQIAGVQLPQPDEDATRACMRRRFPGVPETSAPPAVESVVSRIRALLQGEHDPMLDVPLDMADVPAFNRRVYEITRAIPPGRTLTCGDVAARLGERRPCCRTGAGEQPIRTGRAVPPRPRGRHRPRWLFR
jgi:methylated-DNA-[protein]-cysteine S-methyltransferase